MCDLRLTSCPLQTSNVVPVNLLLTERVSAFQRGRIVHTQYFRSEDAVFWVSIGKTKNWVLLFGKSNLVGWVRGI